ncbi:MAG: transposase [Candidatus Nitrosopolaris sp.]|jgi:hypothetical protein
MCHYVVAVNVIAMIIVISAVIQGKTILIVRKNLPNSITIQRKNLPNSITYRVKHSVSYGQRRIVETVFSCIKRTFGEHVTARKFQNMTKQLIIKASLYNMFVA